VKAVLAKGYRTADIFEAGCEKVSCSGMGDAVVAAM
jgi:3-isopropylmalate dehydrogenase